MNEDLIDLRQVFQSWRTIGIHRLLRHPSAALKLKIPRNFITFYSPLTRYYLLLGFVAVKVSHIVDPALQETAEAGPHIEERAVLEPRTAEAVRQIEGRAVMEPRTAEAVSNIEVRAVLESQAAEAVPL